MKLLLDTHLLLWAAGDPDRLSHTARALIEDDIPELTSLKVLSSRTVDVTGNW